jgi:hypothetical protein
LEADNKEIILVFNHVGGSEFQIDRDPDEDGESYRRRLKLFRHLFGCSNSDHKS